MNEKRKDILDAVTFYGVIIVAVIHFIILGSMLLECIETCQ